MNAKKKNLKSYVGLRFNVTDLRSECEMMIDYVNVSFYECKIE